MPNLFELFRVQSNFGRAKVTKSRELPFCYKIQKANVKMSVCHKNYVLLRGNRSRFLLTALVIRSNLKNALCIEESYSLCFRWSLL